MKYTTETHLKNGDAVETTLGKVVIKERVGFNIYRGTLYDMLGEPCPNDVCLQPVVS